MFLWKSLNFILQHHDGYSAYGCSGMKKYYQSLLIEGRKFNRGNVNLTWLGTAGILINDGETGILIDPYVSRFSVGKVAFRLPLKPDLALVRRWAEKLGRKNITAVIVSHSHFDHVADAPYFANEADAPLIGTESTINVGKGASIEDNRLMTVKPGQVVLFGKFAVKFIESCHGFNIMGRIPYAGNIDKPFIPPGTAAQYRLGGVFSLLIKHPAGTILHHGSAGFRTGMYNDVMTDVILLGIGGRGDTDQYLNNVALKTNAQLVLPIHLDNFFRPLEKGLSFLPLVKFREFCRKTEKYRSKFSVKTLPLCKEVTLLPLDPFIVPPSEI